MKRILLLIVFTSLILIGADVHAVIFDFNSGLSGFLQYGDAVASGGAVRLTNDSQYKEGSIFINTAYDSTSFQASFDFWIGDGTGADGLTFAWVTSPGLGATGGWLGFEGLSGYMVEFDTYYNTESLGWDPNENHIAVATSATNPLNANTSVPEMEDTGWHHVDIVMDAGHITVSMDTTQYILDFACSQNTFHEL